MRRARAASSEPDGPALSEPALEQPGDEAGHELVPADAGLDALVGAPPGTRRRGRMRRRLRHLRRVREVLLRDLGGLVFELHRLADATAPDHGGRLVEGKLARLFAVDAEIRELEDLLEDHRPAVIREPGVGGACPACGELFGSDARFCWACGTPVAPSPPGTSLGVGPAARPALGAPAEAAAGPAGLARGEYVDSHASPIGAPAPREEQPTVPFEPVPGERGAGSPSGAAPPAPAPSPHVHEPPHTHEPEPRTPEGPPHTHEPPPHAHEPAPQTHEPPPRTPEGPPYSHEPPLRTSEPAPRAPEGPPRAPDPPHGAHPAAGDPFATPTERER